MRKPEQKKKGTLSLIASVRAVAVGEEEETRKTKREISTNFMQNIQSLEKLILEEPLVLIWIRSSSFKHSTSPEEGILRC